MAFFRKPETPAQKKKFWFILLGGSAFLILFLVYVQMTIGLVGKRSDFGKNSIFGWVLMIDPQENSCLPYRMYLVNTKDRKPERNAIFAYRAKNTGFYPDGTIMAKYMRGVEGDHVSVTLVNTKVNGTAYADGLLVAYETNVDPNLFVRETDLGKDQYFMLGQSPRSFDSRYWGTISETQILGRAYPLF